MNEIILRGFVLFFMAVIASSCNSGTSKADKSVPKQPTAEFRPDIDIALTATPKEVAIKPGSKTSVYTYEAELKKGAPGTVTQLNSYLGPIIKVNQGQKIRVRFTNQLPRESIIHWHGLHIPPEMDGHPAHAIEKNETYTYEFTVNNRPGTYWFHPHPDKVTGLQVYRGLAGLFIVQDTLKSLPKEKYDIPLIIQDRKWDENNQWVYLEDNRMDRMRGFLGDSILVNGQTKKQSEVAQGSYRLRVLNGSNARIYKLAWSDGTPLQIIGTDGGLLEKPHTKPYLMLAPGERIEIWKDFSDFSPDTEVKLVSLPFESGTLMGMGGNMGMMGGRDNNAPDSSIPNGSSMQLYTFRVREQPGETLPLPTNLSKIATIPPSEAVNHASPRNFHFAFEHMEWVINGETFEMHEVADWEKVKLNTTEIWQFTNGGQKEGMGMMGGHMQMPHPVHIHGLQFQIINRDATNVDQQVWNSMAEGFLDKGWQDTFLLLPGMKVQVIMRFRDFTGKYIYHCHNLEHEDMGMMRNFQVTP